MPYDVLMFLVFFFFSFLLFCLLIAFIYVLCPFFIQVTKLSVNSDTLITGHDGISWYDCGTPPTRHYRYRW